MPTLEEILDKIIELGKANPDFIYKDQPEYDGKQCYYIGANAKGEGEPCIVGKALMELGISKEKLSSINNEEAVEYLPALLGIDMAPPSDFHILETIQIIQERQDDDVPWGKAIINLPEEED